MRKQSAESSDLDAVITTPISRALNNLTDEERGKLHTEFDIVYFVASENLPFTKCPKISELEACHGVDISHSYNNENALQQMFHYTAKIAYISFLDVMYGPLLRAGSL